MVNSFVFSLDITVIFNIVQRLIKILDKEILKVINLYWSHNGTSEKNSSLNDHLNEPWINGYSFVIPSVKKISVVI